MVGMIMNGRLKVLMKLILLQAYQIFVDLDLHLPLVSVCQRDVIGLVVEQGVEKVKLVGI
jgi:hypothetical protein